jgi:hypothetical protein
MMSTAVMSTAAAMMSTASAEVMSTTASAEVMATTATAEVMSAPAEATAMHFRSFVVLGFETAASSESAGIAMIAEEMESAGMRGPA